MGSAVRRPERSSRPAVVVPGPAATPIARKLPDAFDFDDLFASFAEDAAEAFAEAGVTQAQAATHDALEPFLGRRLANDQTSKPSSLLVGSKGCSEKRTVEDSFWDDFAAW